MTELEPTRASQSAQQRGRPARLTHTEPVEVGKKSRPVRASGCYNLHIISPDHNCCLISLLACSRPQGEGRSLRSDELSSIATSDTKIPLARQNPVLESLCCARALALQLDEVWYMQLAVRKGATGLFPSSGCRCSPAAGRFEMAWSRTVGSDLLFQNGGLDRGWGSSDTLLSMQMVWKRRNRRIRAHMQEPQCTC